MPAATTLPAPRVLSERSRMSLTPVLWQTDRRLATALRSERRVALLDCLCLILAAGSPVQHRYLFQASRQLAVMRVLGFPLFGGLLQYLQRSKVGRLRIRILGLSDE